MWFALIASGTLLVEGSGPLPSGRVIQTLHQGALQAVHVEWGRFGGCAPVPRTEHERRQ